MKRIIAMLLVCLMLVQMLPVGIHTHAEELTETESVAAETEAVQTQAVEEPAETTTAAA